MRATHLILMATACVAFVGAFVAGFYMGEATGRDAGAAATFNLDATRSAEAIVLATHFRQALREAKPAKAEQAVMRYAALKAPTVSGCYASPDCMAAVGQVMPTKAQLDDVLAADRALRSQK
ncbi:MAG: hypothetical protein ACAH21_02665 [Ramlibacter sp.]